MSALAEVARLVPSELVDAMLTEASEREHNYVRVTKHAARRVGGRRSRITRKVVLNEVFKDEQPGDIATLVKLDELRIINGMKPRYLDRIIRSMGGELVGVSKNLRTTAGITYATDSLGNSGARPAVANYIALSQDATAPAAGDTTLTGEITTGGLARAQATYAHSGNNTFYTLAFTWTASASFSTVQKASVFNASSGGTMYVENTFTSTALSTNDQLTVTWTLNV